jgi:hypothetical protein
MKKRNSGLTALLILIVIAIAIGLWIWRNRHPSSLLNQIQQNDPRCSALTATWTHVYRPQRLMVLEPCRTATGTVMHVRSEPDGDLHVSLNLDPGQDDLLNSENMSRQHGNLVVEIICTHAVRQDDAISACEGWENHFQLRHGQHVRVTGSHVVDLEHGWKELHPVSLIEEIP